MEPNQNSNNNSPFEPPTPQLGKENLPDLGPSNLNIPSTIRSVAVSEETLKAISNQANQPVGTTQSTTEQPAPSQTSQAPNPWQAPTIHPQESEVFINQAAMPQGAAGQSGSGGGYVTASNPLGVQNNLNDDSVQEDHNPLHSLPIKKSTLLIIIAAIIVLGLGGFLINEFVLNRISSLGLVSDDAQFYLSLSVKKNPQADKAKGLIKKFPGGDRMLKEFDKYYTQYIGSPDDPLIDITQYANTELLLSRISKAENKYDTTDRLFTVVDTESNKKAKEGIGDFEDDKAQFQTTINTFKGSKIINIKQKSEVELYNKSIGRKSYLQESLATPKPKGLFATSIDKFIVASDKEADVEKAVSLSQTRKFFGFGKSGDPKSILDANDHKTLSALFQQDTFLKYFQRDPITPYNFTTPFYYSAINTYPATPESEARTFQKLSRALDISLVDDGAKINTYSLEIPDIAVKTDSFKLGSSLASKLPKKYDGIAPTFYTETKNIKQQFQNQMKIAEKLKDSKNRKQREAFEDYVKNLDEMKDSYKKTYGVDYEKDIISWLDKNAAFIFNAGSAKKSPEFLVVAETDDQKKVETSLKKFRIPNYAQEANDSRRKSDLTTIAYALTEFYYDQGKYPTTLTELTTTKNSSTYSKVTNFYLSKLPKDPTTGADYTYSPSASRTDYSLSTLLEDGRTYTLTADDYYSGTYTGEKKETKITPKATSYKGTDIYSMNIYNYEKSKFYFYFAVAKDKTILSFSDSDKSVKEIIDFKGGDSLTKNDAWKKQFSKVDSVSDVSFIEPINLWGFVEYLQNAYPEYKETASSYTGTQKSYLDDMEKVIKGYLRTIPSVGSISSKKGKVQTTASFVNIVELSAKDKKDTEDALSRLMGLDESNSSSGTTYKSVLGVDTKGLSGKVSNDWNKFYKQTLRQIIDPESVLSN